MSNNTGRDSPPLPSLPIDEDGSEPGIESERLEGTSSVGGLAHVQKVVLELNSLIQHTATNYATGMVLDPDAIRTCEVHSVEASSPGPNAQHRYRLGSLLRALLDSEYKEERIQPTLVAATIQIVLVEALGDFISCWSLDNAGVHQGKCAEYQEIYSRIRKGEGIEAACRWKALTHRWSFDLDRTQRATSRETQFTKIVPQIESVLQFAGWLPGTASDTIAFKRGLRSIIRLAQDLRYSLGRNIGDRDIEIDVACGGKVLCLTHAALLKQGEGTQATGQQATPHEPWAHIVIGGPEFVPPPRVIGTVGFGLREFTKIGYISRLEPRVLYTYDPATGPRQGESHHVGVAARPPGNLDAPLTPRAKALYNCEEFMGVVIIEVEPADLCRSKDTADGDDASELSFAAGEMFAIVDDSSNWWVVVNERGSKGTVPSNFMVIV